MSLITLKYDPTKTTPAIHNATMIYLMTLGYEECARMSEVPITKDEPLIVPPLYAFNIPLNATINTVKVNVPMSDYCKTSMTDDNFDESIPRGYCIGGFYDMKDSFQSQEAVDTIVRLSKQTDRNFRVGTPLEILLFWLKNRDKCPEYFTVLGKVWNRKIIHWDKECPGFVIRDWNGGWGSFRQVFIVEDLP